MAALGHWALEGVVIPQQVSGPPLTFQEPLEVQGASFRDPGLHLPRPWGPHAGEAVSRDGGVTASLLS